MSDHAVMTFREHLAELRTRLVRIVLILMVGFFFCWEFRVEIFEFLSRPIAQALADNGVYHFQAIQITESVLVYLKTAFIADVFLLSPFVFYQLWAFIAPGLHDSERRFIIPLTAFSVVFFVIGAAFSYTVLLPFITDWLIALTYDGGNVEVLVTLQNAYSFAFTFLLMFGLVFELPLIIFFLALWGVATGKGLLKFWRYFVVLSVLISAILTPPDPLSQVLMAVPLNVLYGFGILVAFTVTRARENDEKNVGAKAMRIMALMVVGLLALSAAVVLVIRSVPATPLTELVPPKASYAVGFNPKGLAATDAVNGLEAPAMVDDVLATLQAAEVEVDTLSAGLVIGGDGSTRATILRGDALGERIDAIRASQASVQVIDDDTVVFGDEALVAGVTGVSAGAVPPLPADEYSTRLLRRLRAAGPVWLWWPAPADRANPYFAAASRDLAAAGGSVDLGGRPKISLHLRARSGEEVDTLDAQLETARSAGAPGHQAQLATVVDAALDELSQLVDADPAAAERVRRLKAQLAVVAPTASGAQLPVFDALRPFVRGWSIRRSDEWFLLTSELADGALGPALKQLSE